MNILRTRDPHIESLMVVYQKTLSKHKKLIQINKYALGIEMKYNKYRHKSQKTFMTMHRTAAAPHPWPTNSITFTEILRYCLKSKHF